MREVFERFFNVFDPPPIVINWIEADVPVMLLYSPCICNKATLANLRSALAIHLNNLLSFLLLLIYSGLFHLVLTRSRVRKILGRIHSFLVYPRTLERGRSQWSNDCDS